MANLIELYQHVHAFSQENELDPKPSAFSLGRFYHAVYSFAPPSLTRRKLFRSDLLTERVEQSMPYSKEI